MRAQATQVGKDRNEGGGDKEDGEKKGGPGYLSGGNLYECKSESRTGSC